MSAWVTEKGLYTTSACQFIYSQIARPNIVKSLESPSNLSSTPICPIMNESYGSLATQTRARSVAPHARAYVQGTERSLAHASGAFRSLNWKPSPQV